MTNPLEKPTKDMYGPSYLHQPRPVKIFQAKMYLPEQKSNRKQIACTGLSPGICPDLKSAQCHY